MRGEEVWDVKYTISLEDSLELVRQVEALKIIRVVERFVSPGVRILEAGSGTGRFVNFLGSTRGVDCYGLDYSLQANRLATATASALGARAAFFLGDLRAMPFRDESFEVVFSDSVIEHLEDPESALREMARVTRRGGYMVVSTPNRLRPDGWDLYRFRYKPAYMQKSFTPWQLRRMAENVGLEFQEFFGDSLVLPRSFSFRAGKTGVAIEAGNKRQGRRRRSLGLLRRLEGAAEGILPPQLWVNIGFIARK